MFTHIMEIIQPWYVSNEAKEGRVEICHIIIGNGIKYRLFRAERVVNLQNNPFSDLKTQDPPML